ncbi:MAG: hypothetical protein GY745_00940 [Actinomycetia bacterium]|nr:hypothetical protein [bacterium]MCP4083613.1 hypothetical protein [Actinomycetes bacterium]
MNATSSGLARIMSRPKTAGLAIAMTLTLLWATTASAYAASQLSYHQWSAASITLYQGANGNTIGFWQTLLQSNQPNVCVDGAFGPITKAATQSFQANVAGVTADGIVGPNTWNGTQYATFAPGEYRLISLGGAQYSYYGGSAQETYFKKASWSGVYQWGFRKLGTNPSGTLHSSQRWVDTVTC